MELLTPEFQEQVRREALPVRTDLVLQKQFPGQRTLIETPLIWIDASQRPDVANLWQMHERYGEGDQQVRWLYVFERTRADEAVFYLDIQVDIPKRLNIRYFVAFPVMEHEELIERMSRVEEFGIMTDPNIALKKALQGKEKAEFNFMRHMDLVRQGVMYHTPGREELRTMLNQWRRMMGRRK